MTVIDIIKSHKKEYPEICKNPPTEIETEMLFELAGKYEQDAGTTREEAERKAISEILKKRKPPKFVKIGGAQIKPIRWIVKNLIEAGSLCMIFGDSGTYKSFLSVALASCVATGKDFYGMPIRYKGAVYYIAAEGQTGIIRRFRAWGQENCRIDQAPLYRYTGNVNISMAADILENDLKAAIEVEPAPPTLAIIDTWSRALGSDDSDTTAAAEGLSKIDAIRNKYSDMAFVIVHHTGHSNKDRARGASLLHAAVDLEYKLELDKNKYIVVSNTKNKDSEPIAPIAFKPRTIELLHDDGKRILNEDGEIEVSAVLDKVDYEAPIEGIGKNQEWVINTLRRQEGKCLPYEDLLYAWKCEFDNKKQKGHLDQALNGLGAGGFIYRENNIIYFT